MKSYRIYHFVIVIFAKDLFNVDLYFLETESSYQCFKILKTALK